MILKDRVQISISKRSGNVVLRSDVSGLGSSTQVGTALRTLTQEGKLIKLGSGIYAKAAVDDDGRPRLAASDREVAEEVFERLGVDAEIVHVDAPGGETLYVLNTAKRRMTRDLNLHGGPLVHAGDRKSPQDRIGACLTVDVDELPKTSVGAFIHRLAEANRVVYKRTRLDDWAEAVTQAAGDDVKLDATENLLVALAKKHVITGRQAMRLLNNYMEEAESVRPVQRLPDRRVSPQR
nr:hypothetical protein [uncultured Roseateles sp.]